MLEFALQYQKAINTMTDKQILGLGPFELKENEWGLVAQLHDVLKVSHMSHCLCHLLMQVIIVTRFLNMPHYTFRMDHQLLPWLFWQWTTFTAGIINHQTLNPSIHAALKLAKWTLNRYYLLTDKSETYRITMSKYYSLFFVSILTFNIC
jgi:hypothetical protein